jgi:molybdate transport system substrate-binding protein
MEYMKRRLGTFVLLACMLGCNRGPMRPESSSNTAELQPMSKVIRTKIDVAAASDLKFAFNEVVNEFKKRHPEIQVDTTFGSSGNFFAQLSNKAPFDIFLSADIEYPDKLIEQGDGLKESRFFYAVGHIGIWVLNESTLELEKNGIAVLSNPGVKKIATANPRFAPYGRAAEAALKHFQIYDSIRNKLVFGENIAQTAQFVESGAADVGIISASLAASSQLRDKGRFWLMSTDSYPALVQGGVIVSWAKDREACDRLRLFITSTDGQAILKKYGFARPANP